MPMVYVMMFCRPLLWPLVELVPASCWNIRRAHSSAQLVDQSLLALVATTLLMPQIEGLNAAAVVILAPCDVLALTRVSAIDQLLVAPLGPGDGLPLFGPLSVLAM